jgi:uncharacterized SAM-binding protein YcdF (DUF218 family)
MKMSSRIFFRLSRLCVWLVNAILGLLLAWGVGFFVYVWTLAKEPSDHTTVVDGIVVLTGGQGRIASGLVLFKKGLGRHFFISGVHKGVQAKQLARHQSLPSELHDYLQDSHLGYDAQNTIENAIETAAWIKNHKIASIRLVTADYHIRRSVLEFERLAPGLQVIAHPVHTIKVLNRYTAKLLWREYIKLSIRVAEKYYDRVADMNAGKTKRNGYATA